MEIWLFVKNVSKGTKSKPGLKMALFMLLHTKSENEKMEVVTESRDVEMCLWITALLLLLCVLPFNLEWINISFSFQCNSQFDFSPCFPDAFIHFRYFTLCLFLSSSVLSACRMLLRARTKRRIMKWMTLIRVEHFMTHWWELKCS